MIFRWIIPTFALSVLAAPTVASAPTGNPPSFDIAARFLLAIKPGDTVAKLKNAIPPGVTASPPKWEASEFAIGAYVRLSGKLEGIAVFLTDNQRKQTTNSRYESMPDSDRRYDPKSTIETAMVNLGPAKGKKSTARIIAFLTKELGNPTTRKYIQNNDPAYSWFVEWKRPNKRTLTLTEDSEVHLIESFGTPHQP